MSWKLVATCYWFQKFHFVQNYSKFMVDDNKQTCYCKGDSDIVGGRKSLISNFFDICLQYKNNLNSA